jgi:hypothetical protein
VGVERTLRMGHVYGEVIIETVDVNGAKEALANGRYKIPFKNENIIAIREEEDDSEILRFFFSFSFEYGYANTVAI